MKIRNWIPIIQARPRSDRGSALVPALMIVSTMAMLGLSMLTAGLNGTRSINQQSDDYRLTSAVESVGILAVERFWTDYLEDNDGAAGSITSFRAYLNTQGIANQGPGGPPTVDDGIDLLELSGVPGAEIQNPEFDNVNIDALQIFGRDDSDATTLKTISVEGQKLEFSVPFEQDGNTGTIAVVAEQKEDGRLEGEWFLTGSDGNEYARAAWTATRK